MADTPAPERSRNGGSRPVDSRSAARGGTSHSERGAASPSGRSRRGSRAQRASKATSASSAPAASSVERTTAVVIGILLVVTPLLVLPQGKESFRLVQGLAAGWLGLASLVVASWSLRAADGAGRGQGRARASDASPNPSASVDIAALWRQPAIRALVPLMVVVAAGGLVTAHPIHFGAAFADFLIGAACVVGWSMAVGDATLRRLLTWTIAPAVVVSLLAIDQFLGWFGVLDGFQIQAPTARLSLTSTIGNPGDLASFLVLPMLVAIGFFRHTHTRGRAMLAAALIVMLATMALTATLAALAAVVVGCALLWWLTVTSSASAASPAVKRRALAAVALTIVVGAGAIAVSAPLRTRVMEKAAQLTQGDLNALLTGRLDGWRAAWAMLERAPIAGVGHGAFRAEFADTRLALTSQGVKFYEGQLQVMMATPHNEALSVAAEQGVPGLLALGWAIWCLCRSAVARASPADRALAWAGLAALAVLCVFSFPLHVPAVAWPWLLFLAWLLRAPAGEAEVTAR